MLDDSKDKLGARTLGARSRGSKNERSGGACRKVSAILISWDSPSLSFFEIDNRK